MEPSTHAHEKLTPEQYETIKPLLQLASIGVDQMNVPIRTAMPAEVRLAESKQRFLAVLREHGTITHASAAAGIARNTAWRWRRDDPAFAHEVDCWLHEDQIDELSESLYHIATSKDPKMANAAVRAGEFLLQALDRNTYRATLKTETTQNINVQINTVHTVRNEILANKARLIDQLRTLDQ